MRSLRALAALGFLIAACQSVPYTNRKHLVLISDSQEKAMGLQAFDQVKQQSKLSTDPAQVAMVQRVGRRLAPAAERPDFKWEFTVIDDPKTVNAFCLPGGKVAVYSGLLPVAQDDDGLAVVLGHEISHALARHGDERMSQGLVAQFGGVTLGALLSNRPAAAQNLLLQAYGVGVGVGVMLPFSRKQESEADHIGLILMAKAGYDPRHALDFWQRMTALRKGQGSPLERYLSDHPTDEDRITAIQKELPEAESYYHPATSSR